MTRLPFEFNGVVRFTPVGSAYLAFTLLVGFAAINTGNNSLYIGLSFMLAALVLSGIVSHRGLRNVHVEYVQLGETWAGKPARGWVKVATRSRWFNARDVIVISPQLYTPVLIQEIPRGSAVTVEIEFLFHERGRTTLTHVDLYTRYPFGFFLKKRSTPLHGETIVYPELIAAGDARLAEASAGEVRPIEKPGHGTELYGFRDYIRGDSLRQLHWRKSASLGRWVIKQQEAETGRLLTVVVDSFLPDPSMAPAFEEMLRVATTIIYDALEQELAVVLITPGEVLPSEVSGGRRNIFEHLALLAPTPSRSEVFPAIPPGAALFTLRRSDEFKSA
jgi:uncharacterized protein (DUF58 family)